MFQFRRFPTYCYFIHSTLTRYCRAGFPHSDIHGSQDICSSPWLFAACRVLHRLLMPRHSPCALISLTSSSQSPLASVSGTSQRLLPQTALASLLLLSNSKHALNLLFGAATLLWSHSCSQNYAGFTEVCYCCVTLKFHITCCCCAFAQRPLLPCLFSSSSVQFSRCRKESHSTGVRFVNRCCQ